MSSVFHVLRALGAFGLGAFGLGAFGLALTLGGTACHSHVASSDAGPDATLDVGVDSGLVCPEGCPERCVDNVCVACITGEQCPSGRCSVVHQCEPFVPCDAPTDCSESRPICEEQRCVQCTRNDDCASSRVGHICSDVYHRLCVECVRGDECPSGACRRDHTCTGGLSCAHRCAEGEHIDVFGRCIRNRSCSPSCAAGERCDNTRGECRTWSSTDGGNVRCRDDEAQNFLGRCAPACACPEGEVWYSSLGVCAAPAECAPPLATFPGDPTRCQYPNCGSATCSVDDVCVDGECRPGACDGGPTPYMCWGNGSYLPGADSPPTHLLPAVRVAVLGADALTRRVAIAPSLNSKWRVFWVTGGSLMRAEVGIGDLAETGTCYDVGDATPLMRCAPSTDVAVPFAVTDFELDQTSGSSTFLGATSSPSSAAGVSGLWQLGAASTPHRCGERLGTSEGDALVGPLALGITDHTHAPELYGRAPTAPGYPRIESTDLQRDLSRADWESAFADASDVSPPGATVAAEGGLAAYATDDGRVVIWDAHEGAGPMLLPGFDSVVRGPITAKGGAGGATIFALQSVGGGLQLASTRCQSAALDSHEPPVCTPTIHRDFDADLLPSALSATLFEESVPYLLTAEELSAGGPSLILHHLEDSTGGIGSGDVLFDADHAGARIRRVLAIDVRHSRDDVVWAAIVEVERSAAPRLELWTGGLRVCHSYLGP